MKKTAVSMGTLARSRYCDWRFALDSGKPQGLSKIRHCWIEPFGRFLPTRNRLLWWCDFYANGGRFGRPTLSWSCSSTPWCSTDTCSDRDGTAVDQLNCESNRRWLTMAANKFTIAQSLYCEGFGRRRQRLIIRYIQNNPTTLLGWMLHDFGPEAGIEFADKSILIKLGLSSFAFSIS